MRIGTKSLLFGAHCLLIHPLFVALGWWKLYGFPWDIRLWVAFFIHDIGYWGLPNMDGDEGERHPEMGARIMGRLFDRKQEDWGETPEHPGRWASFCLYHSRYYARRDRRTVSRLCYADKLALALEPWWLYLPRVRLTGEIVEYRSRQVEEHTFDYHSYEHRLQTDRKWLSYLQEYMRDYAVRGY